MRGRLLLPCVIAACACSRSVPAPAPAAHRRDAALAKMAEAGYGGAHWLASFAIYLLTGVGQSGGQR